MKNKLTFSYIKQTIFNEIEWNEKSCNNKDRFFFFIRTMQFIELKLFFIIKQSTQYSFKLNKFVKMFYIIKSRTFK